MCLITCVAGIFGAFLRWLQTINAFEEGTGLPIPGAKTSIAMLLYLVLAAVVFLLLTLACLRRFRMSADGHQAFASSSPAPAVLMKCLSAVTVVASAVLMLGAAGVRYAMLQRVFAAAGIFSGALCFAGLYSSQGKANNAPWFTLAPVLFLCVWLIFSYKNNAEDPVVWRFVIEILAISAMVMAHYEYAAFFYGRGKPKAALFFLQLAVFLSITTLSDSRSALVQLLFVVQIATLLLYEFLLTENLEERNEEEQPAPRT